MPTKQISYLSIYRSYTNDELAEEIEALKTQLRDPYSSVGSGGNNASRDPEFIAAKLEGALKAQRERSAGKAGTRSTLASFNRSYQ
jgi:hypothetical protein